VKVASFAQCAGYCSYLCSFLEKKLIAMSVVRHFLLLLQFSSMEFNMKFACSLQRCCLEDAWLV